MAQLPAPYYYGRDRYVRMYNDLLKKNYYWPWPKSSVTGNYVTLDLANYLFDQVVGTENDLITVEQLPAGVSDTGGSYSDDLQTMFDQGNRVVQSIVAEGGYSMDEFPKGPKTRRKGLAVINEKEFSEYEDVTETRQVVGLMETVDLDQQVNSSVALSVDEFAAIAAIEGILVPQRMLFEGRPVTRVARISLSTLVAAITPLILAQLPKPTNPTNPTDPTVTLTSLSIEGPDSIIEGTMDIQYRAGVIYSNNISDTVTTQGKSVDGFEWNIIGQGEQISIGGILPIYANEVTNDGRTFILELRHTSLPLPARKTITIIDGTTVPPPPPTANPYINLLIDVDSRTIRIRYRLGGNASKAGLVVFRDGVNIYGADNLSTSLDLSLSQNVSPGVYYAVVYEPNNDSNRLQSDPQTIKANTTPTPQPGDTVTLAKYHRQSGNYSPPQQFDVIARTSKGEAVQMAYRFDSNSTSAPSDWIDMVTTADFQGCNQFLRRPYALSNTSVRVFLRPKSAISAVIYFDIALPAHDADNMYNQATLTGSGSGSDKPVDTATIIQALDTEWASNGELTVYGKTSRADGLQFAVANDQGQYSGWFGAAGLNGDGAGYQYKGVFSASPVGAQARIRYRPTTNSAESAIAYLTLRTPSVAQARKTEWANGTQIQPVSGDFRIDYADSNLGGGPQPQFRLLPIWNADGTQVRFRRIFAGQIPDGYQEYWTFDKEGLAPDPSRAVNPYQGRDIENVIWFPPNYNVDIECFWAKGPEVNRGYSSLYCAAIGKATIYTGTKPQNI